MNIDIFFEEVNIDAMRESLQFHNTAPAYKHGSVSFER
jgi:hypothetical protein